MRWFEKLEVTRHLQKANQLGHRDHVVITDAEFDRMIAIVKASEFTPIRMHDGSVAKLCVICGGKEKHSNTCPHSDEYDPKGVDNEIATAKSS